MKTIIAAMLSIVSVSCGVSDKREPSKPAATPPVVADSNPSTDFAPAELRQYVEASTAFAKQVCACDTDECLRSAVQAYRSSARRIHQPGDEQIAQERQFERARICVKTRALDRQDQDTSIVIKFLRSF